MVSQQVKELSVIIDSALLLNVGDYMERILRFISGDPSVAYSPSCSEVGLYVVRRSLSCFFLTLNIKDYGTTALCVVPNLGL